MRVAAIVGAAVLTAALAAAPAAPQAPDPVGGSDADVFAFGDAGFFGSTGDLELSTPIVDLAPHPSGGGYWETASDGGIFTYGDVGFFGSAGGIDLVEPIVTIAATATGSGYWQAARDGGVFTYGDAAFHGSAGDIDLVAPVVDMAPDPGGEGYWLATADGGVFAYGDAAFHGSAGDIALEAPIVAMAATSTGDGYWLFAADGGVFTYGDAVFHGSAGDIDLVDRIVDGEATPGGGGYWLAGRDGGVFTYGDADFLGSLAGSGVAEPVTAFARHGADGYWLATSGQVPPASCESLTFDVEYPGDWETNSGDVISPCHLFDPEPFTVEPATERPLVSIAITVTDEPGESFEMSVRDQAAEVLDDRDVDVAGRDAVLIETIDEASATRPAGVRAYRYLVSLPDGRTLVAATTDFDNADYQQDKGVLDEMMDSLELHVLDADTATETGSAEGTSPDGSATLVDLRVGVHEDFDRVVLEFGEDYLPAFTAEYRDGPAQRPGSGEEVDVDGDFLLFLDVENVRTVDYDVPGQPPTYTGPDSLDVFGNVREVALLGDFEALLNVAIGTDQRAGFEVERLADPARLVVDVSH